MSCREIPWKMVFPGKMDKFLSLLGSTLLCLTPLLRRADEMQQQLRRVTLNEAFAHRARDRSRLWRPRTAEIGEFRLVHMICQITTPNLAPCFTEDWREARRSSKR